MKTKNVKTNKMMLEYKNQGTDSYEDLSKITGLPYTSVVKVFRDPGGVGAEIMSKVSKALHIPEEEAKAEWLRCHLERERNTRSLKWDREYDKIR